MIFSDFEYASKRKQTRRERSSSRWIKSCMDRSAGPDRAFLPQGRCGRKPYPLETMLRIHLLQNWFSLSDTAIEDALYEITPMRQFTRLTSSAPIPKDTTNMNFRHLLESINWPLRSSRSSMVICKKKACPYVRSPSSVPPSFMPPVRPRTRKARAMPSCIRPRKVINTSSGTDQHQTASR